MIVLFTDFGWNGPYLGQVKAVLRRMAPDADIIDLLADAPPHNPKAAAYLLAALLDGFPRGSVFLCVVDPGVGGERTAGIIEAEGRWFVGPDNGLFELVVRRARGEVTWHEILWRPATLSATFHGRDLFAPVAANLAQGRLPRCAARPIDQIRRRDWPEDLAEIVYIDGFGNAMTGIRASTLPPETLLNVNQVDLSFADTFSKVPLGQAFWYENSSGLVEIAINQGRTDQTLGLEIGSTVRIASP